jgi:hypothetical protein
MNTDICCLGYVESRGRNYSYIVEQYGLIDHLFETEEVNDILIRLKNLRGSERTYD